MASILEGQHGEPRRRGAQTKIAIGHVDARARQTTEIEITLPAEAGY